MKFFLLFIFAIMTQTASYKEKFCFNCKFFIPPNDRDIDINYGKCKMFQNTIENNNFLISGVRSEIDISYMYCSTARSFESLCGPYGHYHVRKYEKK